jgi:hypothetical protein
VERAALSLRNLKIADGNASGGGGIFNGGFLEVTNSTISGNSGCAGGGIFNYAGILEVADSTISGNDAPCGGGGILNTFLAGGIVTNSTISGNSASGRGGGIFNDAGITLRNTIVANSTSGGNCFATDFIGDDGYNVEDTDTCGFTQATGSLPNTAPLLDPEGLQDNGGPTKTSDVQRTIPTGPPGGAEVDRGNR